MRGVVRGVVRGSTIHKQSEERETRRETDRIVTSPGAGLHYRKYSRHVLVRSLMLRRCFHVALRLPASLVFVVSSRASIYCTPVAHRPRRVPPVGPSAVRRPPPRGGLRGAGAQGADSI